jgi:hypothetical protein
MASGQFHPLRRVGEICGHTLAGQEQQVTFSFELYASHKAERIFYNNCFFITFAVRKKEDFF